MIVRECRTRILHIFKWIILGIYFSQHKIIRVESAGSGQAPQVKLEDILPTDYDSYQTPKNVGKAADVSVQIEILNIRSVNVVEMSYIADIFLYKAWRDSRLIYPANQTQQKVALNPEWMKSLWTPDVYFYNAVEGKVQETIIPYMYLWLRNDSTLIFGARLSLQFSCDMLLHKFPHDSQHCDIIIKSLTHTINEMDLHWSEEAPLIVSDLIILPQFEYLNPVTSNCTKTHRMGKHGKFACLRGVIEFKRRSGYFIINIYIPSILIVFMSMLTFWIPPDAVPGRVTLGVTSLLTIITKQYQAFLPNVSYVIALNIWLSCCIGFVFCSLLEYAAVIALQVHSKRMQSELSGNVKEKNLEESQHCWNRITEKMMKWIENINYYNIDRTCRFVFPAAFTLQCIFYWAYYA